MKQFMVVTKVDGECSARFFDDSIKAEQYRMDCEVGCGGLAEVYERQEPNEDNDYMGGYVLAWC